MTGNITEQSEAFARGVINPSTFGRVAEKDILAKAILAGCYCLGRSFVEGCEILATVVTIRGGTKE